jgi:hypothetical protein
LRNLIRSRKAGFLFRTAIETKLDAGNSNSSSDSLSPILQEMGRYQAGTLFNMFQRFRGCAAMSETRQILIDHWRGHSNPTMGDRYREQLVEDVEHRQELVKNVGLGFDLPPSLLRLPWLETFGIVSNEEAA